MANSNGSIFEEFNRQLDDLATYFDSLDAEAQHHLLKALGMEILIHANNGVFTVEELKILRDKLNGLTKRHIAKEAQSLWTPEKRAAMREKMNQMWTPEMRERISKAMRDVYDPRPTNTTTLTPEQLEKLWEGKPIDYIDLYLKWMTLL